MAPGSSKHFVLEDDVLEAETMGKLKDVSDLTRAKLWWLVDWVRASPKLQLLWDVPGLQWSGPSKSGPRKENRWTGDRIRPKAIYIYIKVVNWQESGDTIHIMMQRLRFNILRYSAIL